MRNHIVIVSSIVLTGCLFGPGREINNETPNNGTVAPNVVPNNGAPCGNGVLDAHETCDDSSPIPDERCPGTCAPAPRNCPSANLIGSRLSCDALCESITLLCGPNDGCCPGPDCADDPDCQAPSTCGNGMLDDDELCDPAIDGGPGACPEVCPEPPEDCVDVYPRGSAELCDAECVVVVDDTCRTCEPGDAERCECGDKEICEGGLCVMSQDPRRCREACDGDAFCADQLGSPQASCNGTGGCVACNPPCAEGFRCNAEGICETGGCMNSSEPDVFCENSYMDSKATCVGTLQVSFCTGNQCAETAQCEGEFQECSPDPNLGSLVCTAPAFCALAPNGDQWCEVFEDLPSCNGVCM